MSKDFDKAAFKKTNDRLAIVFVVLLLLGVASVVCSFVVGNGLSESLFNGANSSFDTIDDEYDPSDDDSYGADPMDYYGVYYGVTADDVICRINISANQMVFDVTSVTGETSSITYRYRFAGEKYVSSVYGRAQDVIIGYTNDGQVGLLCWLTKGVNGEYTIVDDNDIDYSTEEITYEALFNNPMDYYGTYYGVYQDVAIYKYEITKDAIVTNMQMPTREYEVFGEFRYNYVSAKYASSMYEGTYNNPVLVMYNDTESNIIIELVKAGEEYELISNGVNFFAQEITIQDVANDPKDYYGTYEYLGNTVVLNSDYTAIFTLNGETKECAFIYANQAILEASFGSSFASATEAIVLYQTSNDVVYIFQIESNGNLLLAGQYSFEKIA